MSLERTGAVQEAPRTGLSVLLRLGIALAVAKCAAGLGSVLLAGFEPSDSYRIPIAVYGIMILTFGACGGALLIGGRSDRRALCLGGAYLLAASAFADRPLVVVTEFVGGLGSGLILLSRMQAVTLLPYALWHFARDFPRIAAFGGERRLLTWGRRMSLAIGIALFISNVPMAIAVDKESNFSRWGSSFDRFHPASFFWLVLFLLVCSALALVARRSLRARLEERRRVRLFGCGMTLGATPVLTTVILSAIWPGFGAVVVSPPWFLLAGTIVYGGLASMPILTTYSVLVDRVLDVRLVVRKAVQYALARYTVVSLAVIPFLWLLAYLYRNRDATLTSLFSGPEATLLLSITLVGIFGVKARIRALETIDRHFFREQFDARRILSRLVTRQRDAETQQRWLEVLRDELRRALHPESVNVLIRSEIDHRMLIDPAGKLRSLDSLSRVARFIASRGQSPTVTQEELETEGDMTEEDWAWLADGGVRLLTPLLGSDRKLIGLIALGEKMSELPYTGEDRQLISTVSSAAATSLEVRLMRDREPSHTSEQLTRERGNARAVPSKLGPTTAEPEFGAVECRRCHQVQRGESRDCLACGGETDLMDVPFVLAGKFQLQKRLGAGGMGVVYQALDQTLGRRVAIKTLPHLSARHAIRLRREARAMAAVSHKNLAFIYAVESWMGKPFLVCELVEGETLAERIDEGALAYMEVIDLGLALSGAVAAIHRAGILHRDIKPSNIAYTSSHELKLLDFGLARMLIDASEIPQESALRQGDRDLTTNGSWTTLTQGGHIIGTPLYLSPESLNGAIPDESFDLWSSAVVLYEAAAGRNPFLARSVSESLAKIVYSIHVPLHELRTDCPRALSNFVSDCLSLDRRRRPNSAEELQYRMQRLRNEASA